MTAPLPFDPIDEAERQWRAHFEDAPFAAMAAVTSIMRAQQILLRRLDDALKPHGLRFARYEALMLLSYSRTGSLPLGKMGVRLQVHPTSITSLIDGLEEQGLVTRAPHPSDRRTTLATITARGREVAREAATTLHAMGFGADALAAEELASVRSALRKLRADAGDFSPAGTK